MLGDMVYKANELYTEGQSYKSKAATRSRLTQRPL